MGAMRKMAVYLGLVEDEGLEYAEHDDDYVDPRPRHEEPRSYASVREVRPEPSAPRRRARRRPGARHPRRARDRHRRGAASGDQRVRRRP